MESPSPRILVGEVLASPGPRKSQQGNNRHHSPELAEDSGGIFMMGGQKAWIWVADGASDMHITSGFSSRILAQDLGRLFAASLLEQISSGEETSSQLAERINGTLEGVTRLWNQQLVENKETAAQLSRDLENMRTASGVEKEARVFLEFASTFSIVCLDLKGRLSGASIGDSFLMCNPQGLLQFFALKKNTVTLRLKMEDDAPVFSLSSPPPEMFEKEEVDLVTLATDGTRDTFQNLHRTLSNNFATTPLNLSHFRKALRSGASKVEDDKTLAWVGRVHEG